jgi:hypothetical protein
VDHRHSVRFEMVKLSENASSYQYSQPFLLFSWIRTQKHRQHKTKFTNGIMPKSETFA